ncbi:hypothetical protein [Mediterraneibacter gnavus]|uniref:hypothetical protein n=1 Tax=Mediterraneibacter gnavus TaxID=33038 RepID=UPI0015E0A572|nr:hypothetical protein [Mediterraneibacter gnavus]
MTLNGSDGRIFRNRIAISDRLRTSTEKACVLAEEMGHHFTAVGNIIDQMNIENLKQEQKGRLRGYNRMIGLRGIISAFNAGCQNRYEVAEHLHVTEEYLQEAIDCYTGKYGECTTVDNYVIYFIPNLAVMDMI